MIDHEARSADVGGNHRQAVAQGLEHDASARLAEAGEQEYLRFCIELFHGGAGNLPVKGHAITHTQTLCLGKADFCLLALPGHIQVHADVVRQPRDRADRIPEPLGANRATDMDELQPPP